MSGSRTSTRLRPTRHAPEIVPTAAVIPQLQRGSRARALGNRDQEVVDELVVHLGGNCTSPRTRWRRSRSISAKMSARLRSIIPGSFRSPTIVYVFPLPVAPYANTVPLCPLRTPRINRRAVASYTSRFGAFLPNALSKVYLRSLLRRLELVPETPARAEPDRWSPQSSGSRTTIIFSSMTLRMSLRTPRSCSSMSRGRLRTGDHQRRGDAPGWPPPLPSAPPRWLAMGSSSVSNPSARASGAAACEAGDGAIGA